MNKDKLLDKLIKTFVREKENIYDKSRINYLAHRYARYKSGSNCVQCWDYSPCMCEMRGDRAIQFTPAEKAAYEYQNYNEVI